MRDRGLFHGALSFTEIRPTFLTCLYMFKQLVYNRHIELETRGRAVYPSTGLPHCKKDGECIYGARKRCPYARLVPARTLRNRRLWLECLRLCRFPRLVQTTLLADSAPHDDQLRRFALSILLGPRGQPQLHRLCRAYRGRLPGAARYRRRVPGLRPQQRRLRRHLCRPPPNPRPCRRAIRCQQTCGLR